MPSCTERSSSVRPALRAKITHTIYFWVFITSTLHWHLILATIFRCVCLHRYIKRGNTIYMRVAFSHGSYFFSLSLSGVASALSSVRAIVMWYAQSLCIAVPCWLDATKQRHFRPPPFMKSYLCLTLRWSFWLYYGFSLHFAGQLVFCCS